MSKAIPFLKGAWGQGIGEIADDKAPGTTASHASQKKLFVHGTLGLIFVWLPIE
jgi:hypothetical protein